MEKILINGEWLDAATEDARTITNPATLAPLGRVPDCGPAEVALAIEAATRAQRGWWKVPGVDKARLLRRIGARIRALEPVSYTHLTLPTKRIV